MDHQLSGDFRHNCKRELGRESGGGDGGGWGVGFCLLPPCGLTEMIMVVIEIHTPRRPFAPFPPTKNGIQRTLLPPDREENG